MDEAPRFAAIVLAGGAGSRLGGVDKAAIEVGDTTLLDRALHAVGGAESTVVVGPARDLPTGVSIVSEDPPGSGPAAAVAAGLTALTAPGSAAIVVVLACDMPLVDAADVDRLVCEAASRTDADAVMYVDSNGRRQYLAAAYRTTAVTAAVAAAGDTAGASMRSLVARLTVVEIAAHPDLTLDCDTWPDVERTRRALEDR
jgi:molybdopterin-guanine dinucleotide biosynthesis protein A